MKRPGLKSWTVIGIGVLVTGFALSQSSNLGGPAYLAGVVQLIAGSGVSLSPTNGLGTVTVSATGSGGNVSTSGTPTAGQFAEFTAATVIQGLTLGGDCTLSTATITCTQTSGTAFGTFATQNYATPPAIGGTTPAAGKFTTVTSTDTTNGAKLAGVTGGGGPGTGNVGETPNVYCLANAASNYQISVNSTSGTSPGYITWPTTIPMGGSAAYNWACPIYVARQAHRAASRARPNTGWSARQRAWAAPNTAASPRRWRMQWRGLPMLFLAHHPRQA